MHIYKHKCCYVTCYVITGGIPLPAPTTTDPPVNPPAVTTTTQSPDVSTQQAITRPSNAFSGMSTSTTARHVITYIYYTVRTVNLYYNHFKSFSHINLSLVVQEVSSHVKCADAGY